MDFVAAKFVNWTPRHADEFVQAVKTEALTIDICYVSDIECWDTVPYLHHNKQNQPTALIERRGNRSSIIMVYDDINDAKNDLHSNINKTLDCDKVINSFGYELKPVQFIDVSNLIHRHGGYL